MSAASSPRPATPPGPSNVPGFVRTADSYAESSTLRLRPPRSLPPWIDSYEERYGPPPESQLRLLNPPARVVRAQHNATPNEPRRRVSKDGFVAWDDPHLGPAQDVRARIPHFLRYGRASMRGRQWDHLRTAEPVIVAGYSPATAQPALAWQEFIHSSAWGHMPNEKSEVVDYEVLKKLQPTFDRSVGMQLNPHDPKASRRRRTVVFYKRAWNTVLRHSLSPLLFRLTVMVTSVLALGIAARIYYLEDAIDRESAERTQSAVAVVVDCVAIPYIGYMIWDEYTGKPVGLRSGVSKIRLILLDLFFIIFKSASTALAFESLVYHNVRESNLLHLSAALGVFELVGLISWTMNFTVNIFRTVERLGGGGDNDGERA
ncbi:Regulator of phospholipase D SRF1 [Tolypocladium ophioglossoides CBS 100239]|uniref:Regulator of phospholipase D SRF1 n=1 Tax=Tolypocladium ophioglossoides (strain CBS 100239) TaxID=1163406 RepID=A0A0L0NGT4_TOLOC|nr:Regulator of phospholipase D SRF1 [Tolypocladium ophioglossoides CBS 100239]